VVFSTGVQAGASLDLSYTWAISPDPSSGWNWAFEDQVGGTPGITAVFRHDVVTMANLQ
jgi:hypothetical protein